MKHAFSIFYLFVLALVTTTVQAQTLSITPSSVEVITTSGATRTFYDLDDVFMRYKTGTLVVYDALNGVQLFTGDTSAVTVTSATIWSAKNTKLSTWYQAATLTTGYTFYYPRRNINLLYRSSTALVKFVNHRTKTTLFETSIDSISISGVSGASNKLNHFRNQYFLEGNRDARAIGLAPTIAAGAAAGTSPTIAVAGTSTGFKITLTTGTTAASSGVLATVTLPVTYPNGVIATVTNGDSDAAAHSIRVFTTTTTSTVVLNATGSALSDATQYIWYVRCEGY